MTEGIRRIPNKNKNENKGENKMNEIIKAMLERRSIRSFNSEMPKREDLEQIVEAGLYAANAMGKQATMIVAVTNREISGSVLRCTCSPCCAGAKGLAEPGI